MKAQMELTKDKRSPTTTLTGPMQHAAVHPLADHDASIQESTSVSFSGHDFSHVRAQSAVCPASPIRCPFGGACHTCPVGVQGKLAINRPGDEYEQEADRVAEQVMRMPVASAHEHMARISRLPTAPQRQAQATGAKSVPTWEQLPAYAQRDLQKPGYTKEWFDRADDALRLTVLNLYVKLHGLGLWQYVQAANETKEGCLEFTADVDGLRAVLRARRDFRDPAKSKEEWDPAEKRTTGALHFKHFKGWPLTKVQAHIDQAGLWLDSEAFWGVGAPVTGIRHLFKDVLGKGYRDVFGTRDILLQQGWDPKPLLGVAAESIQRKSASDLSLASDPPQTQLAVLNDPGQPLSESVRTFFEPRFHRDLSQVRIHTGAQAAESARVMNARAYTVGQHVAFGAGEYSPNTSAGRKLIAHELTHVIQQQGLPRWQQAQPVPMPQSTSWNSLLEMVRNVLESSFETWASDTSKWIWRHHKTAADCFDKNLSNKYKQAFVNVSNALSSQGLWTWVKSVSDVFTEKVQGIRFEPNNRQGLVDQLTSNKGFCRDKWPGGGLFTLRPHKWRQVVPTGTPGLHIIVPPSGLCEAHIDQISPVEKRDNDGRCNYDILTAIRHWWEEETHWWDSIVRWISH